MSPRTTSLLLCVLCPTAWAPGVHASDAEEAQDDIRRAQRAFRAAEYADALEAFSAAKDTLEGSDLEVPEVIYRSIARCYDQIGDVQGALAYYKRFLALVDPEQEAFADAVRQSKQAVERLASMIERTAIELRVQPDGAMIRIDGRKVGVAPMEPVKVSPGTHQLVVGADGHDSTTLELNVAPGATIPVVVYLHANGGARRPQRQVGTDDAAALWPAILLGGAATVGAAGAVLLAMSAADVEAEADDLTAAFDPDSQQWVAARPGVQAKYDEAASQRTTALVLAAISGAVGGAAIFMALGGSDDTPDPWAADAAVWPTASPYGAGVAAVLRF